MSKYETRDNSGSLFRNEQKQTDKHPDYSGTCMVDGVEYFFDGWIKTAETGRKWMSFAFKPKQKQPAAKPQDKAGQWKAGAPLASQDSDIPW